VPWCEECAKYLTPTSLPDDGTCPTCGRPVGEIERRAAEVERDESTPWHFKLLVAAVVAYLAWRLVQMVGWLL
jgi:uncharacterized paraquat-inducible protein A